MICPNCREDNAPTFRFCGMCGTALEPRRPAGAPGLAPLSAFPPTAPQKGGNTEPPHQPPVTANDARLANKPVPPISGPSMLGLNQPVASQHAPSPTHSVEFDLNQPSSQYPSIDSLREKSFSGFGSYMEPEEPKTGGRRIVLLVVLLAALGGAAWWTYTNYLGVGEKQQPQPATSSAGEAPAEKVPTKPPNDAAPTPEASSPPAGAPIAGVAEGPSENASASPDTTPKNANAEAKPAERKPTTPAPAAATKTRSAMKDEAKREPRVASAKASKLPEPTAPDTGDAAFRKGEAYLYGRGMPENCDEAVKNLKAASAKSNAKARSAFGTMYATGHCVPRDLPTSYSWFALALRVDPNNQILEKDLSAVWNQMTPPERQMATRMKQ